MNPNRRLLAHAFSLVEVMAVVVIIGLLAGVVAVNVRGYLSRARRTAAGDEIGTIVTALETFNGVTARYPTNEEGIEILARPTEQLPEPPLKRVPTDPWGKPYQYNAPGRSGPFEVICYGSDGREGGEGEAADLSSDDLESGP